MIYMNQPRTFSIHNWISRLLTRRELRKPDQRPLFEYQLTADEYTDLLVQLREAAAAGNIANDTVASAAFCLFCAEWYRREFRAQDGWSWDPIWRRLGYDFSAPELARIVPQGLEKYWNRPVRFYESERRNFLGSLFSEGGLPFQVLTEPGSSFQSLFVRVLKQHAASQALAGSLEPVVKSQVEQLNLPQVFREQTSVELIARMADQLAQLVGMYQLEEDLQPVDVLDRAYPRWRDSFPIPLDDTTGRGFLNGLLTTASKEASKTSTTGGALTCEHYWHSSKGYLETEIALPSELALPLNELPISNRFDLSIHEGRNLLVSIGPSYGEVSANQARVRVRMQKLACKRRDSSVALAIVASIGGQAVSHVDVPGSMLDLGVVPVGFDRSNDTIRWRYAGHSSFTTRARDLALLTPEHCRVSSNDCVVAESISPVDMAVWQISGAGQVMCEQGDVFSIRLGGSSSFHTQVELKGSLITYPTRPSNTYIGVPKAVPGREIDEALGCGEMYLNGLPVDQCHLNERLGTQWLTVKSSAGDTWLRRKVGILPSDFSIELKPGNEPNHGFISFKTGVNCFFEFVSENVAAKRMPNSGVTVYELTYEQDIPPTKIKVNVYPNLESDPVEILLPFPTVGVVGLDNNEITLPQTLSVEELLGARLYLFSRHDCSVQYRLDMRLHKRNGPQTHFEWHYRPEPEQPIEVSLYELRSEIESLLSLEKGIDQKVVLTISGHGQDVVYRIQRHAVDLVFDRDQNRFRGNRLTTRCEGEIRPILMLLSEPERCAIEIYPRLSEGVETGEFDVPDVVYKNGPWLVLPHKDSPLSFRPLYLEGSHITAQSGDDIRSLQRAVLAFEHRAYESVFTPVFNQMALDVGHSGWQFLKSLYDQYNYLSLATFEVWKALMTHPPALAMSLYKFSFDPEYIRHLERDFPLIWETLPIRELKTISGHYWKYFSDQGMPVEVIKTHLRPDFDKKLLASMPMQGKDTLVWLFDGTFPQATRLPEAIMHGMIGDRMNDKSWYQGLLRSHGDTDIWPNAFGNQLKRWYQRLDVNLLGFEPEQDFRNAVVYLPVFLASVSAGEESIGALFPDIGEAIFHIRQIRDFDTQWFSSVYQYALLKFIYLSQKELETQ